MDKESAIRYYNFGTRNSTILNFQFRFRFRFQDHEIPLSVSIPISDFDEVTDSDSNFGKVLEPESDSNSDITKLILALFDDCKSINHPQFIF